MTSWQLAEINIGELRAPLADPAMHDFVAALAEVSERSTQAPGFVWKGGLLPIGDDAEIIAGYLGSPDWLVQLSVWESVDALKAFVYRDDTHATAYRRRAEWFVPAGERSYALWWVAAGHCPTHDEAFGRLACLREGGPSREAFTFARTFGANE